jgi:transposase-like protein
MIGDGGYSASEKLEIIHTVERSHLSARHTLNRIGIPRTTYYRWYDRYLRDGPEGLEDRQPHPGRVWNRIPDTVRQRVIKLALEEPELSPRELAVKFTDTSGYLVSEASVYRILKAEDLITSPAFVVIKAADEFRDKPSKPNEQCRPILLTSRSLAGAGNTCSPFFMTIAATSSVGSCAAP